MKKKVRSGKALTLSLRLDPKTKFSLEFVAHIRGQTLTTVVERAIRESCDQVAIGGSNWQSFWDPEEGVRTLRLLSCGDYPTTYDEDDLREFTKTHWEFFYLTEAATMPRRAFIEILWPKMEIYRRIWREERENDYWAAGKAMSVDLAAAKIRAPDWPRQIPTQRKPRLAGDEILF